MIGAVLLAAGFASRMGGRPKCLLELDGVPLIQRQIQSLMVAGVEKIFVVLGYYAQGIENTIKDLPITIVRNLKPENGQISSLRLGLKALPEALEAVLVALADQPLITGQDIRDLIDAYQQRPLTTKLVLPFVESLPGNPVMFHITVRDDILAGDESMGGKQWQASHPSQVHRWETQNPNYRIDVDTQEDIDALATQTGHQLRWPHAFC